MANEKFSKQILLEKCEKLIYLNLSIICSDLEPNTLCYAIFAYAMEDPILVVVTLVAVIGSFCLLSGLILLCMVSKTLNDPTSEGILLLG